MSTTTDITDDELVARMRAALEELTASPANEIRLIGSATPPRRTQLMMAAAAAVIVIAAVTAIAVNRSRRDDAGTTGSSTPAATAPVVTTSTTTPVAPSAAPIDWYVLAGTDLVAGSITFESGDPSGRPDPSTVMAWQVAPAGLLFLHAVAGNVDGENETTSWGLDDLTATRLGDEIVNGSGLPYVLPDPAATLVAFGIESSGELHAQTYSSGDGSATLSSGAYRGRLGELADATDGAAIAVAGTSGYRYTGADGSVHVFWPTPNGFWASLDISPGLADHADELIAAVALVDS